MIIVKHNQNYNEEELFLSYAFYFRLGGSLLYYTIFCIKKHEIYGILMLSVYLHTSKNSRDFFCRVSLSK